MMSYDDHGLMKRGRKVKQAEREYRQDVQAVMKRIAVFLDQRVSEADRHTIACVFVREHNALLLCENQRYASAISLLEEQGERATLMAADMLRRFVHEGTVLQPV